MVASEKSVLGFSTSCTTCCRLSLWTARRTDFCSFEGSSSIMKGIVRDGHGLMSAVVVAAKPCAPEIKNEIRNGAANALTENCMGLQLQDVIRYERMT